MNKGTDMMINLPPMGDHIRDSEIIATISPPLGDEWPLAVNGNEKAVIWRSGRILDVYSEGRKTVPADARAMVATLRQRRMTVAFGDIAHFQRIHVRRPQFPNLGGFAVDISFSLVRNDRVNVQRLFTLDKARADVITVQDLANGLSSLPVSIRNEVADAMNSHRRSNEPYETNYKFISEIERRIQKTTDSSFRIYGISVASVEVTIATYGGGGRTTESLPLRPTPPSGCTRTTPQTGRASTKATADTAITEKVRGRDVSQTIVGTDLTSPARTRSRLCGG